MVSGSSTPTSILLRFPCQESTKPTSGGRTDKLQETYLTNAALFRGEHASQYCSALMPVHVLSKARNNYCACSDIKFVLLLISLWPSLPLCRRIMIITQQYLVAEQYAMSPGCVWLVVHYAFSHTKPRRKTITFRLITRHQSYLHFQAVLSDFTFHHHFITQAADERTCNQHEGYTIKLLLHSRKFTNFEEQAF